MFFQVVCFCVFVAKNVNGLVSNEYQEDGIIDDYGLIKTLSYQTKCNATYRIFTRPPIFLERHEVIATGDCINHPYFCEMIDNLKEKHHMSFDYLADKLFRYYNILPKVFAGTLQFPGSKFLKYVFPEFRDGHIRSIERTVGDIEKLHVLFKILFPEWDRMELMQIFTNAKTTADVLANLIDELCPSFKTHIISMMDPDPEPKPADPFGRLRIMFPNTGMVWTQDTEFKFQKNIYNFLDLLFHNKLIIEDTYPVLNKPALAFFRNILREYHIENIPKEIQEMLLMGFVMRLNSTDNSGYEAVEYVSKHYKPTKYNEPYIFIHRIGLHVNKDPKLEQVGIEALNYSNKVKSFCPSNS